MSRAPLLLIISLLTSTLTWADPPANSLGKPKRISLELTLPKGRMQRFELSERRGSKQRWIYSDNVLDGIEAEGWTERVSALIDKARPKFELARELGFLPDCTSKPQSTPPKTDTIILLESVGPQALAGSPERAGYMHADNPGPIIETKMWEDQGVETLILHEMVHYWCASRAETQSAYNRWLEEGVADWVAFATTGRAPQAALTEYFANPCKPTNYGSSFLWVLSQVLVERFPDLPVLALLHLDERKDLGKAVAGIFGGVSTKSGAACKPTEGLVAYGTVAAKCDRPNREARKARECTQLWSTPWGVQVLPPPPGITSSPAGFFVWKQLQK